MAFSYSGLTNYGTVTLPSVEGWGTSMNIIRDPPKSVMTRRKDKVGDTIDISQLIGESGDRISENINVFSRGVNPSVSVSYNNVGGSASGSTVIGGQTQSRLPYPIMKDGAFRPPIRRQEELLPLSRLPRLATKVVSNPGCRDDNKKMYAPEHFKKSRLIVKNPLSTDVRPTAFYTIHAPVVEPFEVKYVIQPTTNLSVSSGVKSMGISNTKVMKPANGINDDRRHTKAYTAKARNIHVRNSELDSKPYVHREINNITTKSNISSNKSRTTSLADILDLSAVSVQDIHNITYNTAKNAKSNVKYIHDEIQLSRNTPQHSMNTNKGHNTTYKRTTHDNDIVLKRNTPLTKFTINPGDYKRDSNMSSRSYDRLPTKIQPGGFNPRANIPMTQRVGRIPEPYMNEKSRINKSVATEYYQRYSQEFPN